MRAVIGEGCRSHPETAMRHLGSVTFLRQSFVCRRTYKVSRSITSPLLADICIALTFHDFSALQWPLSASLLGCTGLTSIHCQVQDPDSSFPAIASLVSHYSTQLVTLSIKALSRSRRDDVMGSLFADTSFTTLKELGLFRANHRPIDDLLVHTNGRTFPQLSSLYLEATIWAEVEVLLKRASLRNVHYLEMLDYSGRASRNAEVQLARIAEQLDIKMHIHSAGCDCTSESCFRPRLLLWSKSGLTECLVDGGLATLIR